MSYFDEAKWLAACAHPDWYRVIYPEFAVLEQRWIAASVMERQSIARAVYGFVELLREQGNIAIGTSGRNWDEERQTIDTVVIHHTNIEPGITWQRLDAMHLLRLYAKSYYDRSIQQSETLPVYSHHFRADGQQVFYAYHWLVRMDGSVERLLGDQEIGWHAGNWDINRRSISICFDANLSMSTPTEEALRAAIRIIQTWYPHVVPQRIIGHREANPRTTCPGEHFLYGWKYDLLRGVYGDNI